MPSGIALMAVKWTEFLVRILLRQRWILTFSPGFRGVVVDHVDDASRQVEGGGGGQGNAEVTGV